MEVFASGVSGAVLFGQKPVIRPNYVATDLNLVSSDDTKPLLYNFFFFYSFVKLSRSVEHVIVNEIWHTHHFTFVFH